MLPRRLVTASLSLLALAFPLPAMSAADVDAGTSRIEEAQPSRKVMVMLDLSANHYRAGSGYGGAYGDAMGQKIRLKMARRLARKHRLKLVENWPMERIGVDCIIMEIRDGRSVEDVLAMLAAAPGVAWSQPLNEFSVQGTGNLTYNDKLYGAQAVSSRWKLARLHRLTTGRGVKIAIVDSRIDTAHPDLAGQINLTSDFIDEKTGRAEKHGTGVAGIIAARPNNAVGIAGIAPDATVLGLRACWERSDGRETVCDSLSLAKALVHALEARADVINLSLTGPSDRLLETLVSQAIGRGATVVAAAVPEIESPTFPTNVPGVIPVADERLSAQSSRVYIAPGQRVLTTEPEGKWNIVTGSSYAAAHVTGLVALLRQLAERNGSLQFSASSFGHYGTIDACEAVARVSPASSRSCQ
ncbi:serine protease [Novosphingobium marinum]|uniref:Subtilisin family serine protease n=2 Tax=Novosphingobium marinum TaxID=1514948 RepID=A0A7Z0BVN4_9SPHN|nr:S8 family serine peptidase [Novosphingobium marinum]NYH95525.1 subtilisin family serine protease [Novosphingobium marinum]GGC27744.1 serine protease [Novosphingobium marinum]